MNMFINVVCFIGGIGIVGVFVFQDFGVKDDFVKQGKVVIDFGMYWFKGQILGSG